jgi:signal transduction histidine kinase
VLHKDGTTFEANLALAPIRRAEGDLVGFVGIQSDISRLKELERLKSKFVSNVSHELRTPLTNIKTYLTLLQKGKAERHAHYLDILSQETVRLTRLIEALLDVSQWELGLVRLTLAPADLTQVLHAVYQVFAVRAEAKQSAIHLELPPNLPRAMADARKIEQVATNLVSNAVAYTPENGQIWLRAGAAEREGRPMLWLSVSDNGPGIAPADLPRVFERFYRGQLSERYAVPGTGLGLAISKEIVEAHGGAIDVSSEPGQGTTFTVWLPLG